MTTELKLELLTLLTIINIVGFATISLDKCKAIKHKWRIPERNIFFVAILGGAVGVYTGILIFRHKTKHWKFMVGVPVILALQMVLMWKVWI